MQIQYAVVTTNRSPDRETFRFHIGWYRAEDIKLFRLGENAEGQSFIVQGVHVAERRMDDYSLYALCTPSGEFQFQVKEPNSHLQPHVPTEVFTFHREKDGAWVCEEFWPTPEPTTTHDLLPNGSRGFNALEAIVATKLLLAAQ